MSANTSPIFPLTANAGAVATLTTANTAKDGTGTVSTIYTAGVNGSFVDKITAIPIGTNVASVLRLFLNNGSTNATPANNELIAEATLAASTISEVAAQAPVVISLKRAIPAGYKLNVVIGTAVAAGVTVTAHGGDY